MTPDVRRWWAPVGANGGCPPQTATGIRATVQGVPHRPLEISDEARRAVLNDGFACSMLRAPGRTGELALNGDATWTLTGSPPDLATIDPKRGERPLAAA